MIQPSYLYYYSLDDNMGNYRIWRKELFLPRYITVSFHNISDELLYNDRIINTKKMSYNDILLTRFFLFYLEENGNHSHICKYDLLLKT